MTSAVTTEKIGANQSLVSYDHDPGDTNANVVTPDGGTTERWADLRDYELFAALAMLSVTGTGGAITKVEIVAADDTAGTNLTVIKDSGVIDADAVGDQVFLECTAAEIAHLSAQGGHNLRYVAARVTMDAADAEAVVTYQRCGARFARSGLTPATTIA